MRPVFVRIYPAIALFLALSFIAMPLSPSLAAHDHASHQIAQVEIANPASPQDDGAGIGALAADHCGYPACSPFMPARHQLTAVQKDGVVGVAGRGDLTYERRLIAIDPPIPR